MPKVAGRNLDDKSLKTHRFATVQTKLTTERVDSEARHPRRPCVDRSREHGLSSCCPHICCPSL